MNKNALLIADVIVVVERQRTESEKWEQSIKFQGVRLSATFYRYKTTTKMLIWDEQDLEFLVRLW